MSDVGERSNPFPGPQPYRAADRRRFFGRKALVKKLANQLLAHPSTTLFGPSGSGKSSLMQAGVIPWLEETHDYRVVRVDRWPPGETALSWLVRAVFADLDLGAPARGDDAPDALDEALVLADRRSEQPILIYLDQIEQLLFAERDEAQAEALITAVDRLARTPTQGLQIVLSLREDYLGRFRDRARDRKALLTYGFRVGPLTVGEMVAAVCRAAAEGNPAQHWDTEQLRGLMREVRTPGQSASDAAEVQAAYAQIVCRALFQQRAHGETDGVIEAESILRKYLDATLSDLGPLRDTAERLLEDHLVTADGSRTLRTEQELLKLVPAAGLAPVLRALEAAAILHAEQHQDRRYFEIGHDWLARKVFEERQAREQEQAARRREEAQQRALDKARKERRTYVIVAAVAVAVAALSAAQGLFALTQQQAAESARAHAEGQERLASKRESDARDASILAGFRELRTRGKLAWAIKLLPEVDAPAQRRGWVALASDALNENALRATLEGHTGALSVARWSPDGKHVLTASSDGTARLYTADATGEPVVLQGHTGPVTFAAWSPGGDRVLTTSEDATARIWNRSGGHAASVLQGATAPVMFAAFSPDGTRVVTASDDGIARIHAAGGSGSPIALDGRAGRVTCAIFHPDGRRVFTASEDGIVRLWQGDGSGKPKELRGHREEVRFLALSPDGKHVVSTSLDRTARIFAVDGNAPAIVLSGHEGAVYHAAWSPDGTRVATASADRTARIFSADGKGDAVVFRGHSQAVTAVSFRPDGQFLATASADQSARIWPLLGDASLLPGDASLLLQGHEAAVRSVAWSPDGAALLTAAADHSAKLWSAEPLRSITRGDRGQGFFHAASFDHDGSRFVAAYDDTTARLVRIDGSVPPVAFSGHGGWVTSAAISPKGDRVVTTSFDGTARVWRADGIGVPVVLAGHGAAVRFAVFSPDGERVLTGSDDRKARVFRADGTGTPIELPGHDDWLTSGAWSPDGERVVTTSRDGTARVFPAGGQGKPVVYSGHGGEVLSATFTPDGQHVLTASADGAVRRCNPDGTSVAFIHGGVVLRVAVSPDGRRFASSSTDGTVQVWWPERGQRITLDAPAPVVALAFVDGGQRITAMAADDTLHTWMIDVEGLKARLWSAHADCIPQWVRVEYLREPEDVAANRYAECKKNPMQAPPYAREKKPVADSDIELPPAPASAAAAKGLSEQPSKPPGPAARRTLIVLPGDAEVEVAGALVRRRDGVVELYGKAGEVRKLRVQKGTRIAEAGVTIEEQGVSPPRVDLFDLLAKDAAKAGAVRSSVPKPPQDPDDPLLPPVDPRVLFKKPPAGPPPPPGPFPP